MSQFFLKCKNTGAFYTDLILKDGFANRISKNVTYNDFCDFFVDLEEKLKVVKTTSVHVDLGVIDITDITNPLNINSITVDLVVKYRPFIKLNVSFAEKFYNISHADLYHTYSESTWKYFPNAHYYLSIEYNSKKDMLIFTTELIFCVTRIALVKPDVKLCNRYEVSKKDISNMFKSYLKQVTGISSKYQRLLMHFDDVSEFITSAQKENANV